MSLDPDEIYFWRKQMGTLRDCTQAEKMEHQPIEYQSLNQWRQKVQLAHWHMRRAGMSVGPEIQVDITPPIGVPIAIILILAGLIGLTTAMMWG